MKWGGSLKTGLDGGHKETPMISEISFRLVSALSKS